MDPQTYLLTYRANEARRAVEIERRRQNGERRAQDGHRRETTRKTHRSRAGRRGGTPRALIAA